MAAGLALSRNLRFWQTRYMNRPLPGEANIDEVVDGIGERLHSLRRTRSLTLVELSKAVGTAPSSLSRIESGARRPTLELLLRLARHYRVTLDDLVGAPATGDPRLHPKPKKRYGMTWLPLTHQPGGIQAFKLIVPVGVPEEAPRKRSHEGYEWIYVLGGRLRLLLGENDIVLTAGEVAEFDTHIPHAFFNPGRAATELLILMGAQGQRAHVRARPSRNPDPALQDETRRR